MSECRGLTNSQDECRKNVNVKIDVQIPYKFERDWK